MKAKSYLILMLLFVGVIPRTAKANETSPAEGSITFQPNEMPNIGFEYNSEEYTFDLTWMQYYLTIRPYAIWDGEYYTLKKIIPWLKSNYPSVDYRALVTRFKNFDRWGYYLEKLPQEVADNLEWLGFELNDTNIPMSKMEIEEVESDKGPFQRLHIADKFSMDFYDLIEHGFTYTLNKTGLIIGNVTGKTDLDLDPIVFGGGIITVTGYTQVNPCTFWDVWNASNVNGWNMVNNTCNTQYKFWCRLDIGDGAIQTWFNDTERQIVFEDGVVGANWDYLIRVRTNANARFGVPIDKTDRSSGRGCSFLSRESNYIEIRFVYGNSGLIELYSCSFLANTTRHLIDAVWKIWNCLLIKECSLYDEINPNADAYNLIICDSRRGIYDYEGYLNRTLTVDCDYSLRADGAGDCVWYNVFADDTNWDLFTTWQLTGTATVVDAETDRWDFAWGGGAANTGEVYRNYTFNILVVDKDGTPLQNANVTLTFSGQGGGAIGSWITPANGLIPEQVICKGFYNFTGGDTIYPFEPFNLTITRTGFLPYVQVFDVWDPIDWEISLTSQEDGLVILNQFDIPLLILFLVSVLAFLGQIYGGSVLLGGIATFGWFGTAQYWLRNVATLRSFAFLWAGLGIVSFFTIFYQAYDRIASRRREMRML